MCGYDYQKKYLSRVYDIRLPAGDIVGVVQVGQEVGRM